MVVDSVCDILQGEAGGGAVLEVELQAFFNHRHTLADGSCCEVGCSSCFNRFQFCLRPYNYTLSSAGAGGLECAWGSHTTGVLGQDLAVFQRGQRLDRHTPNPLHFAIPEWNVSVLQPLLLQQCFNIAFPCFMFTMIIIPYFIAHANTHA